MAEFTYQTRKKLTDSWVEDAQKRGAHLSSQEKNMLPSVYHYSIPQDVCKEMRELLEKGTFRSLSEMYRKRFPAGIPGSASTMPPLPIFSPETYPRKSMIMPGQSTSPILISWPPRSTGTTKP